MNKKYKLNSHLLTFVKKNNFFYNSKRYPNRYFLCSLLNVNYLVYLKSKLEHFINENASNEDV